MTSHLVVPPHMVLQYVPKMVRSKTVRTYFGPRTSGTSRTYVQSASTYSSYVADTPACHSPFVQKIVLVRPSSVAPSQSACLDDALRCVGQRRRWTTPCRAVSECAFTD
jgi:hypothetical protein